MAQIEATCMTDPSALIPPPYGLASRIRDIRETPLVPERERHLRGGQLVGLGGLRTLAGDAVPLPAPDPRRWWWWWWWWWCRDVGESK